MNCQVQIDNKKVFNELKELVSGHNYNALVLYANLLDKGIDINNHTVSEQDLYTKKGKLINFQVQYSLKSLDQDLSTDDNSKVYRSSKFADRFRVSTITDEIAPTKIRSAEERADLDFTRKGVLDRNLPFEEKKNKGIFGNVVDSKTYSYEDRVKYHEEIISRGRGLGKTIHKLLEYIITDDINVKDEMLKYKEEFNVSDNDISLYADLIREKILPLLKDIPADKINSEIKISLNLNKFSLDGIDAEGIAGTADIIIDYGDGVYGIYDLKTGKLNNSQYSLMNYASVKYPVFNNAENKSKLAMVMYALMLKKNIPEAKFRKIDILKLTDNDLEIKSVEIELFLNIIKEYFKENHITFYEENINLFDVSNYLEDSLTLQELKEKDKAGYEDKLHKDLYEKTVERASGTLKDDKSYWDTLDVLIESLSGSKKLNNGIKRSMTLLQSLFTNVYRVKDDLIKVVTKIFLHKDQLIREERINQLKIYDKYFKPVRDRILASQGTFQQGVDYSEDYDFAWENGNIKTYKSESWNKLSADEKLYLDYFRWFNRFNLFDTMNPQQGISFIEQELKQREESLSKEGKELLETQLNILKNKNTINKFKIDKVYTSYYEGWVPRVPRQSESNGDTIIDTAKNIIKDSSLKMTEDEFIKGLKRNELINIYPKYLGNKNSAELQKANEYTYNLNLIFHSFSGVMIRKKHLDEVVTLARGISNYLTEKDKYKNIGKGNKYMADWLNKTIEGVFLQRPTDQVNVLEINGKRYDVNKILRGTRNYFSVISMGFNIAGGLKTGIGQSIVTAISAISGSLSKRFFGVTPEITVSTAISAVKDAMDYSFKKNTKNKEDSKLYHLANMTGFYVDSYLYENYNKKVVETTVSKHLPSWLGYDIFFFMYRIFDTFNYSVHLAAQMKTLKVGNKSMWDLYDVVNGELVYKGPVRGVREDGSQITGLSPEEISSMKYFSEKMMGSYRNEERVPMQNGSVTGLLMQYKNYLPTIIQAAWSSSYETQSLTKIMNSDKYRVTDITHELYDKEFNVNSPEYEKLEADGVEMLPVLYFGESIEEGYFRTLGTAGIIFLKFFYNNAEATKQFENLSENQKKNIVYALSKLTSYLLLGMLITSMFGKGFDDEDKNKFARIFSGARRELVTELFVFEDRNFTDQLLSAPTLSKVYQTVRGLTKVAQGQRVTNGNYKGWLKGSKDLLNASPLAPAFRIYELHDDYDNLDKDITRWINE